MLHDWALQWGIPLAAVQDLQRRMGTIDAPDQVQGEWGDRSEAAISNAIRMEASRKGMRLFRNNVGQLLDDRGVPVRYGLANDSPALNKALKSSDLIGWDATGRFLSVEVKAEGWRFTGTARELAQERWLQMVTAAGGRGFFANREGLL